MRGIIVVTGTGTEVGKTVATAAMAAAALERGLSVAVLKPAQTGVAAGEPADVETVRQLAGEEVTGAELARYPEPLAPGTAARRSGLACVAPAQIAEAARRLAHVHDLVLVEGAGGLLVRFDDAGATLADAARLLDAEVVVVAAAGLGTLNATALTTEALRARGLRTRGVVIGSFPAEPDLATRCNVEDLPAASGAALAGALPAGAGAMSTPDFRAAAPSWLTGRLGGSRKASDPRSPALGI
ncbi:dethiobiotin synthase [Streptomyces sp. WMMB 322]|uniref:dethiobiotin synthase n=1 Tax=Streptomyces sp. WMMB 322 TaxID=1286821 RepID=UPI0006E38E0C|nr:dethiobiotin synthase [Streptomyces sp. WMMB 322]SCK59149.1 dethiobiotin synthetase [Streptomyces sp. WMMB 322]